MRALPASGACRRNSARMNGMAAGGVMRFCAARRAALQFAHAPPTRSQHRPRRHRPPGAAGGLPSPAEAARAAERGGADFITLHLREDRRHITDADLPQIAQAVSTHINLEIAAVPEMREIALKFQPAKICLVPERREEITTEGGLNAANNIPALREFCAALRRMEVSLFVDAQPEQVRAAKEIGAAAIELHTGPFANADNPAAELEKLQAAARLGAQLGMKVNAGHGLRTDNVGAVAAIPQIAELNIGHAVVARAILLGMENATREMAAAIAQAR